MIVRKGEEFLTLVGEDAATLRICKSNRGEPYREGVEMHLEDPDGDSSRIFLDRHEAVEMRDLLNRLYP